MNFKFEKAEKDEDIKKIFAHTVDAFSDSPDFNWTLAEIKKEIKAGWDLYAVILEEEVIAALFLTVRDDSLLTKNTAVKMHHQGSGYSHRIKEFFETRARESNLKYIYHYCQIDNFRMYSLNESYNYKKTKNTLNDGYVVEWVKKL